MKSVFRFTTAGITLLGFSFFACLPASAKETAFTKLLMNKVAAYMNAPKDKGNAAFVDAFANELSQQDKAELKRLFKGSTYPSMKVTGPVSIEIYDAQTKVQVEFVNEFGGGKVKINGKEFSYDSSRGMEKNVQSVDKILNSKSVSFWNWLVPEANASPLAIMGIILVAFLGVVAVKKGGLGEMWNWATGSDKTGPFTDPNSKGNDHAAPLDLPKNAD